ncbi:MAG TPA: FAD-dependent monooxygenase, partial [Actinomycetospora sp.]|nr:FAD-dependent monooxygenase [Actinomycetospora sp.]
MTRVVVAGAGIGGLTLGIALARAGVTVDLHERADELREVGAAVALPTNGTRLLYRLGVGEALDAVSTQPTELIHRDGRSGARIAAHRGAAASRERFGAPYWGVQFWAGPDAHLLHYALGRDDDTVNFFAVLCG